MKDLDQLLGHRDVRAVPRRALSVDFTAQVVSEITAYPNTPRKEPLMKRLFARPAAVVAAVALVVLLGGTSYAITDGFTKTPDFSRIFGYSQTQEASGDRVLAVATTDCSAVKTVADSSNGTDRTLYFRVKKDTNIPNDDVLKFVQGYCEYQQAGLSSGEPDGSLTGNIKFYSENYARLSPQLQRVAPCGDSPSTFCDYKDAAPTKSSATPNGEKALAFITKAYREYEPQAGTDAGKQAFKAYTTPELAAKLDRNYAADTVMCSQGPVENLTFGSPTKQANDRYSVALRASFTGGSPFTLADVTYDPALDKITSIDCAPVQ